jgi:DNA ligase-1
MKLTTTEDTKEYVRHFTPVSPSVGTLPVLYKKTNTGAIMAWSILVQGRTIETSYGQVGGAMQGTSDEVKEGKNLGRKNATTPEEQAVIEAAAKWRKKQEREGYVASYERAMKGETDTEGGIAPMLAQPLEEVEHKIKFPCDVQPKLNGLRCIVIIENGKVSLWSRRRQRIVGVPHVEEAYARAFDGAKDTFVLDGELYRHGWSLQTIGGFVRKKGEPKPGYEALSHFVYDIPSEQSAWAERRKVLYDLDQRVFGGSRIVTTGRTSQFDQAIHMVQTIADIGNMRAVKAFHDDCVKRGYEGAMIRNVDAPYEAGKRSSNLIKVKDFLEKEFQILSVRTGRGRMQDGAIFTCVTEEGREFEVTAPGSMEEKARYLPDKVIGKNVTVRFQEWSEEKKPLQPRAVVVRDYE